MRLRRRNGRAVQPGGKNPPWKSRLAAARSLVAECGDADTDAAIEGHPALEALGGHDDALGYLYRRWKIYFGAALDQNLEDRVGDVAACAWKAWAQTMISQPKLARILSRYRDDDVVREADWSHRGMLGRLGGCDPASLPGFSPMPAVHQLPARQHKGHLERKVG
jgi:hypothetical protein